MRIDRVDGADVPGVEVDRVVQEEIDLLELFLLDVDHRVRELAELARVVPVGVTQHDPGDLVGIETDRGHLVANALPAAGGVPVEDVRQLLPAAVVERQIAVRVLDDPDVDRQVDRGVETRLVRLECAERYAHEPAALDDPRRVERSFLGALHVAQQAVGALEAARYDLRRPLVVGFGLKNVGGSEAADNEEEDRHHRDTHQCSGHEAPPHDIRARPVHYGAPLVQSYSRLTSFLSWAGTRSARTCPRPL